MRALLGSMASLVLCLFVVSPVSAQSAPKERIGAHIFGIVDAEHMTASKSFSAVVGKATFVNAGVGAEVTHLWQGLFVRFEYTRGSRTGSRVDVVSGIAHSNGIPLTIEISPVEVGGGWRFPPSGRGSAKLVPYIGAAVLLQRYKETSTFASDAENTDETDKGAAVFAGFEVGIGLARIGLEGQYRRVPNVVGAAGASQAFNEHDLGGGVVRVTFGVGF